MDAGEPKARAERWPVDARRPRRERSEKKTCAWAKEKASEEGSGSGGGKSEVGREVRVDRDFIKEEKASEEGSGSGGRKSEVGRESRVDRDFIKEEEAQRARGN